MPEFDIDGNLKREFRTAILSANHNYDKGILPYMPDDLWRKMFKDRQAVAKPMIITGYHSTMVIDSVGDVYGCGCDSHGQLGRGTDQDREQYRLEALQGLPPGVSAMQITVSSSHTVVLGSTGTVYSCGANSGGQLGNGNNAAQSRLVAMQI